MPMTAVQNAAKATTMVVINPWMYVNSTTAMLQVATIVATKAAVYTMQSLQESLQASVGIDHANEWVESAAQASQMAELFIEQAGVAPNIAKFFIFRLNPEKLDRRYSKVRSNTFSGAGLIMDTHGNQGVSYSYSGTMGNMRPAIGSLRMPQLTAAWHYLHLFKRFYKHHDQDLIFVLDNEVSVGRFDTFDFALDANNPWLINYRFQATMYPGTEFGLADGYVGDAFNEVKGEAMGIEDPFGVEDQPMVSKINVFSDTYGLKHIEELNPRPS